MPILEQYLDQISRILQACEDTDGVFILDKNGVVEYCRSPLNFYFKPGETIGRHILELYPELTEETSTVMRVLKTGKPSLHHRQELVNCQGQRVILDSTTLPILVDGVVQGAVDSSQFYTIGQQVVRGGGQDGPVSGLDRMITQDPAMLGLKRRIRDVAQLDSPVLIYGETGTGKELVAEALHSEGKRAGKPFVAQNCAAIPPNLLESIFFGTEKGSYTGAVDRKGLFEAADGGTLFLDEINSMDVALQAKLLKALEEQKVRHVGGHRDIPFDVRILCAMNEDPRTVLREKRIREDLYYRVGVVKLTVPPLRDRPGDIPLLTRHFIDKFNRSMNKGIRGVSSLVEGLFQQYRWPGNIRELQNTIEGAFATAQGDTLVVEDVQDIFLAAAGGDEPAPESPAPLPRAAADPLAEGFSLTEAMDRYEKELIQRALAQSGSVSDAARRLGVSRQNLKYKLQKYGL